MSNRIIIPAKYTFELIIKVDPRNGQSEMQVKNTSGVHVGMMQIVGLLLEHATTAMRTLITNAAGVVQNQPCKDCGIFHAGTCESASENKPNGGDNHAT